MKKIVILNGSPRTNGNTKALIEHFTKGAKSAGNEVACFDLQKMNIHGCLGCCKGGQNPESPVFKRMTCSRFIRYTGRLMWWYSHHPCIIGGSADN